MPVIGRLNQAQRAVLLLPIVGLLSAIAVLLVGFDDDGGDPDLRCSAPLWGARYVHVGTRQFFDGDAEGCAGEARDRWKMAGLITAVSAIGGYAGVSLLDERRDDPRP